MLKKLVERLLRHHHPWRNISFDELSEIYVAMMLRSLSVSMTGIFVPIFLYRLHYALPEIISVFACYFTARMGLDILAAYTVARFGPKHTLVIGQILQIIASLLFLSLQTVHWPLPLLGVVWGSSASFFFIPFHVDFSKIKHRKHGGEELGYEQIMERIGYGLGPLVGGIVASLVGGQYIFLVAVIVLVIGLWPLFQTSEPVRIRQKLDYKGLEVKKIKKLLIPYFGLNVENTLCITLWPLFLAMFVLTDKAVFAEIGVLATISMAVSVFAAHAVGKTVDEFRGRALLRYGASANALLHIGRLFVSTYPMALVVNVMNEIMTVSYRLPFTKGFYDAADDLPGYRIVFISSMESLSSAAKASMWWSLVLISSVLQPHTVFVVGFACASVASLAIMSEKFKALNPKSA